MSVQPDRLVLVFADPDGALGEVSTGYLVRPHLILTCSHGLKDVLDEENELKNGASIEVRFAEGLRWVDVLEVEVVSEELDMALLSIEEQAIVGEVSFGRFTRQKNVRFDAAGYPSASKESKNELNLRQSSHFHGEITTAGSIGTKLYELDCTSRPEAPRNEPEREHADLWRGFSGAPVIAEGCLVGVVQTTNVKQPTQLRAGPVS